jgi:hypothetical protein
LLASPRRARARAEHSQPLQLRLRDREPQVQIAELGRVGNRQVSGDVRDRRGERVPERPGIDRVAVGDLDDERVRSVQPHRRFRLGISPEHPHETAAAGGRADPPVAGVVEGH